MERVTSHLETGERYTSLRIVGALFTVFGALFLAGSCLLLAMGLYTLRSDLTVPPPGIEPLAAHSTRFLGAFGGWFWILCSLALLMSALQSVAIGALIRVAIHLEENTRVSAQCLEVLRLRTETSEPLFRS